MVEVKIMVSKFVDQREPLQEPERAEICRIGARWQSMVVVIIAHYALPIYSGKGKFKLYLYQFYF